MQSRWANQFNKNFEKIQVKLRSENSDHLPLPTARMVWGSGGRPSSQVVSFFPTFKQLRIKWSTQLRSMLSIDIQLSPERQRIFAFRENRRIQRGKLNKAIFLFLGPIVEWGKNEGSMNLVLLSLGLVVKYKMDIVETSHFVYQNAITMSPSKNMSPIEQINDLSKFST